MLSLGFRSLYRKEVLRFIKVGFQTVAAPVVTALLYLAIFSHAFSANAQINGLRYETFLVPGLVMMSVLQNAFANTSSSLIQSKITGSVVFMLLAPLSYVEFFLAYVLAGVTRGLIVGLGVWAATWWLVAPDVHSIVWSFVFLLMGASVLACLGVIAGVWADKFDQLAAFQNFLIMPLTFLSGVFYSIKSLPDIWQTLSRWNPVFYMIDGFRYGFLGVSDVSPWASLVVLGIFVIILMTATLSMLQRGYKLRA